MGQALKGGPHDQQMESQDQQKKAIYNVRNPLEEREDLRIGGENTVAW